MKKDKDIAMIIFYQLNSEICKLLKQREGIEINQYVDERKSDGMTKRKI